VSCNVKPCTASVRPTWYIACCNDTTLVCAVLLRLLKKGNSVGHLDNASDITEKKILISTRIPEENATKFRHIRRVARKATISFVMSACQFACPRETARFTVEGFL
jgi:hypothetical protein